MRRFVPDFVFDPPLRRESIVLEPASLEASLSLDERLAGAAGLEEVSLAVLRRLPSEETRFSVLTHDGEFLTAEPEGKDGEEGVFAAAVDIGTTTVVVSLIDMGTGRELGSASDVNPQKEHGRRCLGSCPARIRAISGKSSRPIRQSTSGRDAASSAP